VSNCSLPQTLPPPLPPSSLPEAVCVKTAFIASVPKCLQFTATFVILFPYWHAPSASLSGGNATPSDYIDGMASAGGEEEYGVSPPSFYTALPEFLRPLGPMLHARVTLGGKKSGSGGGRKPSLPQTRKTASAASASFLTRKGRGGAGSKLGSP
jgi:hypothetical protein